MVPRSSSLLLLRCMVKNRPPNSEMTAVPPTRNAWATVLAREEIWRFIGTHPTRAWPWTYMMGHLGHRMWEFIVGVARWNIVLRFIGDSEWRWLAWSGAALVDHWNLKNIILILQRYRTRTFWRPSPSIRASYQPLGFSVLAEENRELVLPYFLPIKFNFIPFSGRALPNFDYIKDN